MSKHRLINPERIRRCQMKRVYDSWAEAEAAAMSLIEAIHDGTVRRLKKPGVLIAYQCAICNRWHVGHDTPPANPWNHWRSRLIKHPKVSA